MYLTQVDYGIPLMSLPSLPLVVTVKPTPIPSSEQTYDPSQEKMKYLSKEEVSDTIPSYTKVHTSFYIVIDL